MKKKANSCTKEASDLLVRTFGEQSSQLLLRTVPGRVNLIGEHIDYHLLPVLPMAIDRGVTLAFRGNGTGKVRAISTYGQAAVTVDFGEQRAAGGGDWSNYIRAAVNAVQQRWPLERGMEAAVASDLPVAAGLSSSTALMTAFALALLQVNGVTPSLAEWMEVLPEGEQFVGTRGGSMDHAAVLAGLAGHALDLRFAPFSATPVAVPAGWGFLVAHSLQTAEKSGAVREKYNALKGDGLEALRAFGRTSFLDGQGEAVSDDDDSVYAHVVSEAARVGSARDAMTAGDLERFGLLLLESHASMSRRLRVSTPAIDELVAAAMDAGAAGARLTGAGFGGCVLMVCRMETLDEVKHNLMRRHYHQHAGFHVAQHLFSVVASDGALANE